MQQAAIALSIIRARETISSDPKLVVNELVLDISAAVRLVGQGLTRRFGVNVVGCFVDVDCAAAFPIHVVGGIIAVTTIRNCIQISVAIGLVERNCAARRPVYGDTDFVERLQKLVSIVATTPNV